MSGAVLTGRRDGYLDGLRALALVRVIAYHTLGFAWLPLVFPSMSVMFALGGSLVAASLDRRPHQHYHVLYKRVRRLLPPLWALGVVLLPVMLALGWTTESDTGEQVPPGWSTLLPWLVPYAPPTGGALGESWTVHLWYVCAYLWFLLLSPALLWAFRAWGWRLLLLPLLGVTLYASGVFAVQGELDTVVLLLGTYGACWVLGFAHHDGRVRSLPRARTSALALGLAGVGLAYAFLRLRVEPGLDLGEMPLADALYGLGFTLVLLLFYPREPWQLRGWAGVLVAAVNARALTIYLWGGVSIWSAGQLAARLPTPVQWLDAPVGEAAKRLVLVAVLLVGAVLALGWVEDLAAGRHPRINPVPPRQGMPRPQPARWPLGSVLACLLVAVALSGTFASPSAGAPVDPGVAGATGGRVRAAAVPRSADLRQPRPLERVGHPGTEATLFWIGAVFDDTVDGQSVSSAWNPTWAQEYGGCDGLGPIGRSCRPDPRRPGVGWFPTAMTPKQNPFYVGLPFDDVSDPAAYAARERLPWAGEPEYVRLLDDRAVSLLKNRWVAVTGPARTCYAQVSDSGPGRVADPAYVLHGARHQDQYGINLSPAVFSCAGLDFETGSGRVDWRFADDVPEGPWTRVVTRD